jgi:hypothetical protein
VLGVTIHGLLPSMVTVMASIDCLPLAAVITSSPHFEAGAPRCCTLQAGTPVVFTVPVICVSLHVTPVMATPPTVTFVHVAPHPVGVLPKP